MATTTLMRHREEMKHDILERCHAGKGSLDWTIVLETKESREHNMRIRYFHDDVLPPGASIGVHRHDDEEHYYVLSGQGIMTLDGERHHVEAGDLAIVFPGGEHGLENSGEEGLRFIVVCV